MADLIILLNGMALIGHGERGEAWLVDTDRVQVGHQHSHSLRVGTKITVSLSGGQLVAFEDNGKRLGGPLALGDDVNEMVDLDVVLPKPTYLRQELATAYPEAGGPWKDLLAAWVRLPGGDVDARPEPSEVWSFANGGDRTLTELVSIKVKDVTAPRVTITGPNGQVQHLEIPQEQGAFRVTITTAFAGSPTEFPPVGQPIALDEVKLLYACVVAGSVGSAGPFGPRSGPINAQVFANDVPTRTFTEDDVARLLQRHQQTDDLTVCPPGCVSLDNR